MSDLEAKLRNLERTRLNYNIHYSKIAHYVGMNRTCIMKYLTGQTKRITPQLVSTLEAAITNIKNGNQLKVHRNKEVQKMLSEDCLKFYNLSRHPFLAGNVPSKEFFAPANTVDIENKILHAVKNNEFLLVYGEVGMGKSVLLQRVIKKIERLPKQIVCFISPLFVEKFTSAYIADEIIERVTGLPAPCTNRKRSKILATAILKAERENKKISVVLDEVHRMSDQMLMHLKRFYEGLGVHTSKISVVCVGQPSILDKLDSDTLREVRMRMSQAEMNPFAGDKEKIVIDYITLKLQAAGDGTSGINDVFTSAALKAISERCETPLQVNVLCTNALYQGFITQESRITEDVINDI